MTGIERAQWQAFNKVLHWINAQETKSIDKGDLYDAVMEMRPDDMSKEAAPGSDFEPSVSIRLSTLKWWRQLSALNPDDLAPRMDELINAVES